MVPLIYWVLAAGQLIACVLALRAHLYLLGVIAAALCYDNLIIALGAPIGAGSLLLALSWPRYAAHALLTPLLIIAVVRRAWTWALAALLIAIGIFQELIGQTLGPETFAGTLRYVNVDAAGPPIPAIVTILALLTIGIWQRRPPLVIGAAIMFVCAATSVPYLGNLGELVLIAALLRLAMSDDDRVPQRV